MTRLTVVDGLDGHLHLIVGCTHGSAPLTLCATTVRNLSTDRSAVNPPCAECLTLARDSFRYIVPHAPRTVLDAIGVPRPINSLTPIVRAMERLPDVNLAQMLLPDHQGYCEDAGDVHLDPWCAHFSGEESSPVTLSISRNGELLAEGVRPHCVRGLPELVTTSLFEAVTAIEERSYLRNIVGKMRGWELIKYLDSDTTSLSLFPIRRLINRDEKYTDPTLVHEHAHNRLLWDTLRQKYDSGLPDHELRHATDRITAFNVLAQKPSESLIKLQCFQLGHYALAAAQVRVAPLGEILPIAMDIEFNLENVDNQLGINLGELGITDREFKEDFIDFLITQESAVEHFAGAIAEYAQGVIVNLVNGLPPQWKCWPHRVTPLGHQCWIPTLVLRNMGLPPAHLSDAISEREARKRLA